MSPSEHDWIARADARDPMSDGLAEARRRVRRVRRLAGSDGDDARGPAARVAAWLRSLAPGRRRRALADLASGLEAALDATERAAEWSNARVVYLTALVEGLARGRPRRAWEGAAERPVLLLGTGGGGTRVLAEAAARLGLFLGATVNESFDSAAWAPLVYGLVTAHGDRVDLPRGDAARARLLDTARAIVEPWLAEGAPYGWKLPEFLLVLPLLLDAFPRARPVLLVRHPVAAALRRPHVTTLPEHPVGRAVLGGAYRAAGRDPARVATDPPHVRQALAWAHQVGRAHRFLLDEVPAERRLLLRLEEFALSPIAMARRLATHLETAPPRDGAGPRIDAERAVTPADVARAAEVRAICGEVAARVGYGPGWLDAPWEDARWRDVFAALG